MKKELLHKTCVVECSSSFLLMKMRRSGDQSVSNAELLV